jgi:hypothetical protein
MKPPALRWIVRLVRRLMIDRRARLAAAVAAALCLASIAAPNGMASDTRSELQAVALDVPSPQCGDTITTSVHLRTDLICPGDGLIVGADNIVIDLNGHTIRGEAGSDSIGIADGVRGPSHSNVTIRNGTISGYFGIGVALHGSRAVSLVSLQILAIRYGGFMETSLELVNTTGVTVRGGQIVNNWVSRVIDASGDDLRISGTTIRGSNPTPVAGRVSLIGGATIKGSSIVGVAVYWTGRLVVADSEMSISSINAAVPVGESLYSAKLTGNTFSGSPGCITCDSSDYYTSIVTILGEPSMEIVGVEIRGNTFDRAAAAGVFIQAPASTVTDTVISGNTFSNNGYGGYPYLQPSRDINGSLVDDGLHITVPPGTDITVADNQTSNNADYGIEAVPGTVIDGGGNVSSNDPRGCLGVTCTYVTRPVLRTTAAICDLRRVVITKPATA